jgi:hypothetical protein
MRRVCPGDRLDLDDQPAVKREYVVKVFHLIKTFRPDEVEVGVRNALRLGAIGFAAVAVSTETVQVFGTKGF